MQKKILWVAAALVLIAIPAVIGFVALRGDDTTRRSGALFSTGSSKPTASYRLEIPPITPSGKAIAVESFSWGISNAGAADRSGLTAGKPQFTDLVITKGIDQTSPLLANHVATGNIVNTAVLTLYKQDASGIVRQYAKYTMTNVLIGNVSQEGKSPETPTEAVSLNYQQIVKEISTLDAAGLSQPEMATFDLRDYVQ